LKTFLGFSLFFCEQCRNGGRFAHIFGQGHLALVANPTSLFLAQDFWKLGYIRVFRALGWLSSIFGAKNMV